MTREDVNIKLRVKKIQALLEVLNLIPLNYQTLELADKIVAYIRTIEASAEYQLLCDLQFEFDEIDIDEDTSEDYAYGVEHCGQILYVRRLTYGS